MKCNNCGFENEQTFQYCPNCGAAVQLERTLQVSTTDGILLGLKDSLFLVICILMSGSCLLSFAGGGFNLIYVLITVFLWLTYAQSRKGIADPQHLRCISGTVYAQYVINYVMAGLLVVLGVICAAAFGIIAGNPAVLEEIFSEVIADTQAAAQLVQVLGAASGMIILGVCVIVAVIMVLWNVFSLRYIHRFAKSVYRSVQAQTLQIEKVKAAKIWLFILGGFDALSALSSLADGEPVVGMASACTCGAAIIAGLLIRKYLSTEE